MEEKLGEWCPGNQVKKVFQRRENDPLWQILCLRQVKRELRTGHQILKHDTVDYDKSSAVKFVGVNSRANRTYLAYKYKMFTIKHH